MYFLWDGLGRISPAFVFLVDNLGRISPALLDGAAFPLGSWKRCPTGDSSGPSLRLSWTNGHRVRTRFSYTEILSSRNKKVTISRRKGRYVLVEDL